MEPLKQIDLVIEDIDSNELKPKVSDDELVFGTHFTDRMLVREYSNEKWQTGKIQKFHNFSMSPASLVFHYGQAIFEGLKAYKQINGDIALFRPDKNAQRFYKSAQRMVMPPIDPEFFVESIKKLVALEKGWIPTKLGTALYIRPTMIASEAILGVRPSHEYIYFVILSPSGPYFKEGFAPTKILVEDKYVRAAIGGVGEAKTAGNYAASLYAAVKAKKQGYSQVLWLDSLHKKYVEEVGAMNIAFVLDDVIYTSPLKGTILPGVTRDSVLQLSKDLGYKVKEEALSIDKIEETIESGHMTEIFGMGTAAIIAPVGGIKYKDDILTVGDGNIGKVTAELYEQLTGIQYGKIEDRYDWITKVVD